MVNKEMFASVGSARPEGEPGKDDTFEQIMKEQMGPEYVVGTSGGTLEQWDKPEEDSVPERPFGEDFLRKLARAGSKIKETRTPAEVTVTGTDSQGNTTEVKTSSPD